MYAHNPKRKALTLLALMSMCMAGMSLAQEAETPAVEKEISSSDVEEVVVLGRTQRDAAMSAFRSGDFVTAERNFIKNAKCALRRERSLESLVQNQNIGIERATISQNAQSVGGGSAGNGPPSNAAIIELGAQASAASSGVGSSSQGSADNRVKERKEFTCENRGFQLYMAGLAQIQLGQPEKALNNFKRATSLSRTLYDAHYRIGLISLLNKDVEESRKQLKQIGKILKKCKKKCTVKDEIDVRHQHLKLAIEKAES